MNLGEHEGEEEGMVIESERVNPIEVPQPIELPIEVPELVPVKQGATR